MNDPIPQLKLEDLKLAPDQLEAMELGKRMLEIRRLQDEAAAELVAAECKPWKRVPWYRRLVRWVRR